MLKKLVALTLGVGLFCSAGICHTATIENYITGAKGTVKGIYLHKVTQDATGALTEWVCVANTSKDVSKTNAVVDGYIDVSGIDVGTYDAVAVQHTPFKIKGYVDVKNTGDDRIDGKYVSTATSKNFVKNGQAEESFTDDIALPSTAKKKFWDDMMKDEVSSIYSEDNPDEIITGQKLSNPIVITEEKDEQGDPVKYANRDLMNLTLRITGVWAGRGWPGYETEFLPLTGDFNFADGAKQEGTLEYGDPDEKGKKDNYKWTFSADGKHTLVTNFLDGVEIREPKAK